MAQPPQGLFSYPGIRDFDSVTYTLNHGINPGRFIVKTLPGSASPVVKGVAQMSYGGSNISMPDCRLDKVGFERTAGGELVAVYEILDKRWKWANGHISGVYNRRHGADDEFLERKTEKTPRELAKLCLEAMGEKGNVTRMPNDSRPFVEWSVDNPAEALNSLCDAVGARLVLRTGGKVTIEPQGKGANLPNPSEAISGSASIDPPEPPEAWLFKAAPTAYQGDFRLEAVGVEKDGKVVLLSDLSYKPAKGWEKESLPELPNVKKKFRELAQSCVYKYYRIKEGYRLPSVPKKIKEIERILPLLPQQVEVDELPDGEKKTRPAWVFGQYYIGESSIPKISQNTVPNPDLNKEPKGLYTRGFTLDQARGLVIFNDPVYILDKKAIGFASRQPKLFLRVAVNLHDEETRAPERFEEKDGRSRKEKPRLIVREDVGVNIYPNHTTRQIISDKDDVMRQAKYYIKAAKQEIETRRPMTLRYAGLIKVDPDGAIQQVVWAITRDGAFTVASRNEELADIDANYNNDRLIQRLVADTRRAKRKAQKKGLKNVRNSP